MTELPAYLHDAMEEYRNKLVKHYQIKLKELNEKGMFDPEVNEIRIQNMLRSALSKVDRQKLERIRERQLLEKEQQEMEARVGYSIKSEASTPKKVIEKSTLHNLLKKTRNGPDPVPSVKRSDRPLTVAGKFARAVMKKSTLQKAVLRNQSPSPQPELNRKNSRPFNVSEAALVSESPVPSDYDETQVSVPPESTDSLPASRSESQASTQSDSSNVPDRTMTEMIPPLAFGLSEMMEKYVEKRDPDMGYELDILMHGSKRRGRYQELENMIDVYEMYEDIVELTNRDFVYRSDTLNSRQKIFDMKRDKVVYDELQEFNRQHFEYQLAKISNAYSENDMNQYSFDKYLDKPLVTRQKTSELFSFNDKEEKAVRRRRVKTEKEEQEEKRKIMQYKHMLTVCDSIERSVFYLCNIFGEKRRAIDESEVNSALQVAGAKESLLASLRSLPSLMNERAKRTWTKGAEVFFLWSLELKTPFSIHEAEHLKQLAKYYVELYMENERILDNMVTRYKETSTKAENDISDSNKILENLIKSGATPTGTTALKIVQRWKTELMRKQIPSVDRSHELKKNLSDRDLKKHFFENISEIEDTEEMKKHKERIAHNKRVLFVIVHYLRYCNDQIQDLFKDYVRIEKKEYEKYSFLRNIVLKPFEDNDLEDSLEANLVDQRGYRTFLDQINGKHWEHEFAKNDIRTPRTPRDVAKKDTNKSTNVNTEEEGEVAITNEAPQDSTQKMRDQYVKKFMDKIREQKKSYSDVSTTLKQIIKVEETTVKKEQEKEETVIEKNPVPVTPKKKTISFQEDTNNKVIHFADDSGNSQITQPDIIVTQETPPKLDKVQQAHQKSKLSKAIKSLSKRKNKNKSREKREKRNSARRQNQDVTSLCDSSFNALLQLEGVWDDLLLTMDSRANLFNKYNKEEYLDNLEKISKAYWLWRAAGDAVRERESILKELIEFEHAASDPRRLMRSKASDRLAEEKKRTSLFKKFNLSSKKCEKAAKSLAKETGDNLMYKTSDYLSKMASDYSGVLYTLEESRLETSGYSDVPETSTFAASVSVSKSGVGVSPIIKDAPVSLSPMPAIKRNT